VQRATSGEERVGEHSDAAEGEKSVTPVHPIISEGEAPRSTMARVGVGR